MLKHMHILSGSFKIHFVFSLLDTRSGRGVREISP